jgi:hypothetical protein
VASLVDASGFFYTIDQIPQWLAQVHGRQRSCHQQDAPQNVLHESTPSRDSGPPYGGTHD